MQKYLFVFLCSFLPAIPVEASVPSTLNCFDMPLAACRIFHATNSERARLGLPALSYCPKCYSMAQEQSEDMDARGYFGHDRPALEDRSAESFEERAERFGLAQGVGENIALSADPSAALAAWMKSPGHRRNILNGKYGSFAVGSMGRYFTQVFKTKPRSR